jgi:hypothetical protein
MISRTGGARARGEADKITVPVITTGHLGCGAVTCGHQNQQVRSYQGAFRSDSKLIVRVQFPSPAPGSVFPSQVAHRPSSLLSTALEF